MMRQNNKINYSCVLLLLLFLIFTASSLTSARLLAANHADDIKETKVTDEINSLGMVDSAESNELMGLEACESGDEAECLKRRMVEEAHLDYIYTQQLEP
ncbi:hypothetical protein Leryth_013901 [Lithospermum erythrorhizon]|uniref:Phytosulfokine n=1 Tax=Lithospermum erythrorhizon TaxID=34254 RepID=A0AAV3PX51_LITER|nr:hypothetical protein Leryth_013901 [Lithospermum erythrorhizon]